MTTSLPLSEHLANLREAGVNVCPYFELRFEGVTHTTAWLFAWACRRSALRLQTCHACPHASEDRGTG
jgi:hypothetical protein